MSGLVFWIIIIFIIIIANLKKVPQDTLIIIDRNTHFHKKKRSGFYSLGPNDKVTTYLSLNPYIKSFSNIYETHSSSYYRLNFSVTYKSEDLDMSANALQDSKRSVDDVINCAAETVIGSYTAKDFMKDNYSLISNNELFVNLKNALFAQLESTLEPFYIDVMDCHITGFTAVNAELGKLQKFQRHVSSGSGDNPFV